MRTIVADSRPARYPILARNSEIQAAAGE